jgi:transcription elongation GreA/GreB family factor
MWMPVRPPKSTSALAWQPVESPIAKALLGHAPSKIVVADTPRGETRRVIEHAHH